MLLACVMLLAFLVVVQFSKKWPFGAIQRPLGEYLQIFLQQFCDLHADTGVDLNSHFLQLDMDAFQLGQAS